MYEIAANSLPQNVEEPGLSDLIRALDLVASSDEFHQKTGFLVTADIINKVHRLLFLSQKQKTYESVISIQSEIYSLQGNDFPLNSFRLK